MSVNKNNNGVLQKIAGGTLYADAPIGCIQAFGGTTAPAGWILCQGQALSRTTYSALFKVIGTSFGVGDGSTTFNIPDLRGEFLRGAGTNSHSGEGNGGTVGEHQGATRITTPYIEGSAGGNGNLQFGAMSTDGSGSYSIKNQDSLGTDNSSKWARVSGVTITSGGSWRTFLPRPTNTSVNYIIKVMQSSVPLEMMDNYSTEETVVGTWIDGKPLYRKVYHGTSITIPSGQTYARQVIDANLNTGVINTVDIRGGIYYTGRTGWISFDWYAGSSNFCEAREFTDGLVINFAGAHFQNQQFNIIIEYTKIAD